MFHVSLLKPYFGTLEAPPEPIEIAGEPEYEVEAILGHRSNSRGKYQFLIKWKGYPSHEATWEPEEHLENAA